MHWRTDTQSLRLTMNDVKELVMSQQVILHQDLISKDEPTAVVFVDTPQRGKKQ